MSEQQYLSVVQNMRLPVCSRTKPRPLALTLVTDCFAPCKPYQRAC